MRTWVIALGLGLVLAACTPSYHDATVRYRLPGGHTQVGLFQIVEEVSAKCTPGVDRVRVVVNRPDVRVRLGCDEIARTRGYAVQEALVHAVRNTNDALTVAGRYMALQRVYPRHTLNSFDSMIWSFAGQDETSMFCQRTREPSTVHDYIDDAKDETPVQWTLVEAVWDAAQCPERLTDLYDSVAKAGYPDAAREARAQMAEIAKKAGVTLPASALEPA